MTLAAWNVFALAGMLLFGIAGAILVLRRKRPLPGALLLVGAPLMASATIMGIVFRALIRLGVDSIMAAWPHWLLALASGLGILILGLGTLLVSLTDMDK